MDVFCALKRYFGLSLCVSPQWAFFFPLPVALFGAGTAKYEIVDVPIHFKSPPKETAYINYMRRNPEV